MLRSWTAPLYQTLTTTQRLHIIWRSVPWSEAPPPNPSPNPLQKTKRCSFLNKPDIKWESTAVYNRCWDVCSWTLCPHDPTRDLVSCFLRWTVARRCWVIWCVTKKWKPLCKSPLWVPSTIGKDGGEGGAHLGHRCRRGKTLGNTEVHIMLFKYKKRTIWHVNHKKRKSMEK